MLQESLSEKFYCWRNGELVNLPHALVVVVAAIVRPNEPTQFRAANRKFKARWIRAERVSALIKTDSKVADLDLKRQTILKVTRGRASRLPSHCVPLPASAK